MLGVLLGRWNGDIETIRRILNRLIEDGLECGAHLNTSKTQIYCPGARSLGDIALKQLSDRIPSVSWTTDGVKLLGGAIGEQSFIAQVAEKKVSKCNELIKILQLQDPHRQLTLLKYCSSGYKLNHLMRVTDASHSLPQSDS